MTWYKKAITKYKNKIISSAMFSLSFALAILLWHFGLGQEFSWKEISPVPEPDIFDYTLYSALVYVTFGALFYKLKIYRFLYNITVRQWGDWQLFRDTKGLIWGIFILIMYFWVVPWTIKILNSILSFLYNILNLVLYLFPVIGISLIVYSIGFLIYKKYQFVVRKDLVRS
jgi:hypothetical protein